MPVNYSQEVANKMVAAGIGGIWNFAPTKIQVPEHICLVNEELSVSLNSISYHLARTLPDVSKGFK